ncbi:MAG: type II toxin-antitoxin system RelE/ParE family toxin [Gemmataceae bacterium]
MKPLTIHADAEAELCEAVLRFEQQREGLGGEFREEFEATLESGRQNPYFYAAEDESGARPCPLNRFSYTLVYLDLEDHIWIVAVAHHRRRPRYWARRKPE